jgi:hypothetical protein
MYTLGGITLFVFVLRFIVFTFQESPKFLLGKGKDEEALRVLETVAKTNKKKCNVTLDMFEALTITHILRDTPSPTSDDLTALPFLELPGGILKDANFSQKVKFELLKVKILFSTATLARLTVLVWIIYGFDYWGFSIAGEKMADSPISPALIDSYRCFPSNHSTTKEHRHKNLHR